MILHIFVTLTYSFTELVGRSGKQAQGSLAARSVRVMVGKFLTLSPGCITCTTGAYYAISAWQQEAQISREGQSALQMRVLLKGHGKNGTKKVVVVQKLHEIQVYLFQEGHLLQTH